RLHEGTPRGSGARSGSPWSLVDDEFGHDAVRGALLPGTLSQRRPVSMGVAQARVPAWQPDRPSARHAAIHRRRRPFHGGGTIQRVIVTGSGRATGCDISWRARRSGVTSRVYRAATMSPALAGSPASVVASCVTRSPAEKHSSRAPAA